MKVNSLLISGILCTVVVFLSASKRAAAQEPLVVKPGDEIVNGSHIKPFAEKYVLYTTSPDGKENGKMIWGYQVKITEERGRKLLNRILNGYDTAGNKLQSRLAVVDHKTLTPVKWSFEITGGPSAEAVIDGSKVQISQTPPGAEEAIRVDYDLGMQTFDYINLHGIMLLGFPLKEGFSAKFPFYNADGKGGIKLEWLTIYVKGYEKVNSGSKKNVEAWLVETSDNWKYWLSRKAPYIIKVIVMNPDGSKRIFELM